jgi:hypothetical protein
MNHYEQATQEVLDAFEALCRERVDAAVKAEREACAKAVENYALGYAEPNDQSCIKAVDYCLAAAKEHKK